MSISKKGGREGLLFTIAVLEEQRDSGCPVNVEIGRERMVARNVSFCVVDSVYIDYCMPRITWDEA